MLYVPKIFALSVIHSLWVNQDTLFDRNKFDSVTIS